MYNSDLTGSNSISYKVNVNLYVFCPLTLYRIRRKIHVTDIVIVYNGGLCYSASVLDLNTVAWLLEDQEMMLSPK